jgi:hypothetical protein
LASNLITGEHLAQINDAIGKLKEAEKEIALAERAGLVAGPQGQKLADYKQQVADNLTKLQNIKSVYFPNQ